MKPFWSIDLANDSIKTSLTFHERRAQLNDHGLFEIPRPGMQTLITLFVNDTTIRNNQTVIRCVGELEVYQTIVYIYGKFIHSGYI